ncbi:RAB6-interacting golgin isoform 1-T1 [Pholidichthys leucotaenia]
MSGWAGFSEEELRRIQRKDSSAAAWGRKPPPPVSRTRQQLQRERAMQLAAQKYAGGGTPGLSPGQQLTKSPPNDEPPPAVLVGAPTVKQEEHQKSSVMNKNHKPAEEMETPTVKELEKQEAELVMVWSDKTETEEILGSGSSMVQSFAWREKTRLEQLQQEQKIIEERNKRKKALLAKTIAEKSKQTQAEAVKLKRIQKELQALDDMVSNDIGILRGKIEQASWDYTAARKRYEKAEVEYVTAKVDLHKKTEVKEQLTEHLCAIIQQNELRKAHKLEELMQQLQLQATEEELERQKVEREETRRNGVETQRDSNDENGPVDNQGEMVQSTKEERGGSEQQEDKPVTEKDHKTLENCLQAETLTF